MRRISVVEELWYVCPDSVVVLYGLLGQLNTEIAAVQEKHQLQFWKDCFTWIKFGRLPEQV